MSFQNTLEFAQKLDNEDSLGKYRDEFHFPKIDGKQVIYFTGNSLGLQPKSAQRFVNDIMTDWKDLAVEGHFHSDKPWWDYHERLAEPLAKIVGQFSNILFKCNMFFGNKSLVIKDDTETTKERDSLAIKRVISLVL